jgi:diguanylate cyclase (GGDEF)-like protein
LKNKEIILLPLLCAAVSVALILASLGTPRKTSFPNHSDELATLNEGWNLTVGGVDRGLFSLPEYTGARAGETVVLERNMPAGDLTRVYLCFRTTQLAVRAYIDDMLVYSYGEPATIPYGRSPGAVWNTVDLSSGGEKLRLEFTCNYSNRASAIGTILIGTRYSLFYALIQLHMAPVLISALTMLCGITLLLVGLYLFYSKRISAPFHLGVFCITASVWCLMESNAMDLLFPYPFFVTQIGFLCLMVCPIPMMLFLRAFFDLYDHKLCNNMILGGCGVFCLAIILQLVGAVDLFISVFAGYFVIIVYSVYFFIVMVQKSEELDTIGGVLFRSAVAAIALFTVADVVSHFLYLRGMVLDTQDLAYYFRIGFLMFILMLAAVCVRQVFVVYRRGVESDVLKRMLENDMMTGLSSRRMFDADMEFYRRTPPGANLAMIMFDLNNLKLVNDTLGHKKGDDLIRATAALVQKTFSPHGNCYRIGGDEFIAILPRMDHSLLEARIAEFDLAAQELASNGDAVIDTAVGYGFFAPGIDADISALFTRVDDAMYRNKRLKKEQCRGGATETTGRRSTDMHEVSCDEEP